PASDRWAPHPAAWDGAPSGDPEQDGFGVRIGDRNVIREYCSVHQGTQRTTTVGGDCYFLRSAHVAHDCRIGDGVTLGSNVVVGGHSEVWSLANLGLGVVVHQKSTIGPGAMVGMGAAVTREIAPFTISRGVPAHVTGLNIVGLSRRGVSAETIAELEPYLRHGSGEPPALPEEVSALLKEWAARRTQRGTSGQD
ncbi:MAG: UDP-N-acetylglucosamine acyltransferase, partial [Thermocrispum sp.]